MRTSLIATAALSLLLGACASTKDTPVGRQVAQSGSLKVHPGLLGQQVPDELRDPAAPAKTAEAAPAEAQPMQMDAVGLRTQRSVYFDYKSTTIKPDYEAAVQAHGKYLAANPKAKVRVEGNADERGSAGYNLNLGQKRAENVRQMLLEQGADGKQVALRSLGESQPKLKGHDEESWAENRRADIVYEREE
jgi:peptidoglycan-associated lipoprotein